MSEVEGFTPVSGSSCNDILSNCRTRAAFGYELESASPQCHDITVEDVRDIGITTRTLCQCIPYKADGISGCRGGFLPDGDPSIYNIRVMCNEEDMSADCDRINNEIGFEVVLNYCGTFVVVNPRDTFSTLWYEFAQFPSGDSYDKSCAGKKAFTKELSIIDGSAKVIIIEDYCIERQGNDCVLRIVYKVIEKLWKKESLLVSAIKPYPAVDGRENVTVSNEFESCQSIGNCIDATQCKKHSHCDES